MSDTSSPPIDPGCPFCKIASSPTSFPNVFLDTPQVLGFLDIQPLVSSAGAHLLITPRYHYETLDCVPESVAGAVGAVLPVVVKALKRIFSSEANETTGLTQQSRQDVHVNVIQNNGVGAGQVVPHVHFHIVARTITDQQTQFLARSLTGIGGLTGREGGSQSIGGNGSHNKPEFDWSRLQDRLSYAAQVYGRGQREDMDDVWCSEFIPKLKQEIKKLRPNL